MAAMGAIADVVVMHSVRKRLVYDFFGNAASETALLYLIMIVVTGPLDELTQKLFNKDRVPPTTHDLVRTGGIISAVQGAYWSLLSTWHEPDLGRGVWGIVDAVRPDARSSSSEEARRFARRNILIFATGKFRRFELVMALTSAHEHRMHCELCTPNQIDREKLWKELADRSGCCKSMFQRHFMAKFDTPELRWGILANRTLRLREELRKGTTMESEGAHAKGHRILSAQRKPKSTATFCRSHFLSKIKDKHVAGGGNAKWHLLDDKRLLAKADMEQPVRRQATALEDENAEPG